MTLATKEDLALARALAQADAIRRESRYADNDAATTRRKLRVLARRLAEGWTTPPRPPEATIFLARQRHAEERLAVDEAEVAYQRRAWLAYRLHLRVCVLAGTLAEADAVTASGLSRAQWDAFCTAEDEAGPDHDGDYREGWILEVTP